MPDMRTVILTVEVKTDLTVEELKTMKAMVFGTLKQARHGDVKRWTIKAEEPSSHYHDMRGTIVQVDANVIKDKAKSDDGEAKPKRSRKKAS